ncbi:MAG: hypothetical protein KDJ16_11870 [Hyphomicrobiales bacterium]|nr:hypothetical protein [Hyphomicrobiales bacterium]
MTMAASLRDHRNRPVVAVTGVGAVTSLGAGKTENWAALTSGKSGIHRINRFPVDGLRTTIAGTVDYLDIEPFSGPALTERLAMLAADEAITQAGIGSPGAFPGPLFMGVPPVEAEWPHRRELYAAGKEGKGYKQLLAGTRNGDWKALHHLVAHGRPAELVAERFGTRGAPISLSTACASGATAIQLGFEPIRRG